MRKYGWTGPAPHDWTRPLYTIHAPVVPAVSHVDRLTKGIEIRDQMQEGSCTGFGSTRAIQYAAKSPPLSPQFMYFCTRDKEATEDRDLGANIYDCWKAYAEYGVATEAVYPYVEGQFAQRPTLDAFADAMQMKQKVQAQRVSGVTELLHAVSSGHPVVFGFSVPRYFETAQMQLEGFLPLPGPFDDYLGGHCVVMDGYDLRDKPYAWVANSWGKDWGPYGGWYRMDLKWFSDPRGLVDDLWAVLPA